MSARKKSATRSQITQIVGREILDSRGNPTIEVDVRVTSGTVGRASVPSGASTGSREALELRDQDAKRYGGKGVRSAVESVQGEIAHALKDRPLSDQASLDQALIDLDGTPTKSRLGANAILGTSLALARAIAIEDGKPLYRSLATSALTRLPTPMVNVLNGGVHAGNALDFQEFMIVPVGATSLSEGVRWCAEVFHALRTQLSRAGHTTSVGDEGGYAPNVKDPDEALQLLVEAIQAAGYVPGKDVALALDPAASELWADGRYEFHKSGAPARSTPQMTDEFESLLNRYPIISIEDGLGEQDWEGWRSMTARLGPRVQLVCDDIFVTNPEIIRHGIKDGVGNAVLIKPNQIGTVTETLTAIAIAQASKYGVVVSHRSGETEDTFIADLAVAVGAQFIKTGSMSRSERLAKYNQLMRIEADLQSTGDLTS